MRWIWVGASVAALVVAMFVFGALYWMLEATFAIQVGSGRGEMLTTWLVLFGAGYLQWFYAAPAAWHKWRDLRDRQSTRH